MAVTPANKIVRGDDLTTVAQEIDKYFQRKATGKGLSTNDYTTDEKTKLAGIESGAQKNVKPDWNAASGSAAEILNKPAAVQPATVAPKMDGTAAVGSSTKYAKEDHVHPSDSSKANVQDPTVKGELTVNSGVEESSTGLDLQILQIDPSDGSILMKDLVESSYATTKLTFPAPVSGTRTITLPANSGTLALTSDIPEDKIFVATYNVTTFAQVKAAYDAGKIVIASGEGTDGSGEYYLMCSYYENNYFKFSNLDTTNSGAIYTLTLNVNNSWSLTYGFVAMKSTVYTKTEVNTALAGKQDTISDLATIRSGASAGATAYQKPSTGIPASDLASNVLSGKQDTLVSGTNIKTVNNTSLLGGGNITIEGVGISTVTSAQDGTIVITLTNGDEITVDLNHVHPQYEKTENKVTSLSASSTDTQYPSAKAVYDIIGDVETALAALL